MSLPVPLLTELQIEQIISEQPSVADLYSEMVPVKISHEEFWARFFQSRYYFQMVGLTPPPGSDEMIFPDFRPDEGSDVSACVCVCLARSSHSVALLVNH